VPFVYGVELAVLGHDRLDPLADRLATLEIAEHVLDVVRVLGEQVCPRVPVLAHRAGGPVRTKRLLDFLDWIARHGAAFTIAAALRPASQPARRRADAHRRRLPVRGCDESSPQGDAP